MCGYDNALCFKSIEDDDIEYVEKFIQSKALSICAKTFDESLGENTEGLLDIDQMTNIFGTRFAAIPNQFEFLKGDIKTIKTLVEHVKGVVDRDGVNRGLNKFKVPKQKKNCVVFPWLDLDSKEKLSARLKEENCLNSIEVESRFPELKLELYKKTESYLNSYNVDEPIIMGMDEEMVEVCHGNNGHIYGIITCVVCKTEKKIDSTHRVYFQQKKNSNHWVMANYLKHLKDMHGLIDTKKILSKRTASKKPYR